MNDQVVHIIADRLIEAADRRLTASKNQYDIDARLMNDFEIAKCLFQQHHDVAKFELAIDIARNHYQVSYRSYLKHNPNRKSLEMEEQMEDLQKNRLLKNLKWIC